MSLQKDAHSVLCGTYRDNVESAGSITLRQPKRLSEILDEIPSDNDKSLVLAFLCMDTLNKPDTSTQPTLEVYKARMSALFNSKGMAAYSGVVRGNAEIIIRNAARELPLVRDTHKRLQDYITHRNKSYPHPGTPRGLEWTEAMTDEEIQKL